MPAGDTDDGIVTRAVMYLYEQMQRQSSECQYTFRSAAAGRAHSGKACSHLSHVITSRRHVQLSGIVPMLIAQRSAAFDCSTVPTEMHVHRLPVASQGLIL